MMSKISHGWAVANLEARIAAHLHAWDKAKGTGQPLAQATYPFVTISRETGCGGVAVALRLSEILNERCRPFFVWVPYDHELLDRVARELHLQRGVVEAIDQRRRDEMAELFDSILTHRPSDGLIVRKMAEVIRSLAIHGHAILVSRGSHLLTQDLKTALHVRLTGPREWRIQNIAEERGLSHDEAVLTIDQAEKERQHYLSTYFVMDPAHPFSFDLAVDNSRFNVAQVAELIFTALGVRFGETLVGA